MATRLFGVETEYAMTALDHQGQPLEHEPVLRKFMEAAKATFPSLPDTHSSGLYLGNGGRLYIDHGQHLEFSTPECTHPSEAVRYILAGDQILSSLAADIEQREASIGQILLWKGNIDYSGSQTTWGCHESYLHKADLQTLPKQLIPHLASRLIYTGAGGFNSRSTGLEYTLSPRVSHLMHTISDESTMDRGIFHTKNETLSIRGYHRLHLLCGESLCSEKASWLKLGTTALVVALIEAGLVPGDAVQLRKPLQAMGKFANDPTCKAVAESVNGQLLTALAIQHHYLTQAEEHAHKPFMPPWAKEVCREWRAILNQLEREPDSVAGILDWRMKLPLYHSHARRRGYDWDSLATWSEVTAKIQEALQAPGHRGQPIRIEMLLSQTSPIAKVKPFLASRGLTWDEFRSFFDLRNELFEIDTRFSQLSGNGIFAGMDDAQVLAHHVPSVNNIKQAMTTPPMVGRAHLRGIGIQRLAEGDPHYVCDWTGIVDTKTGQILDLQDPFANNECWQDFPKHDKQNEDLEDPMSRLFQQHGHPLAALRARVTHRLRSYISNP